MSKLQLSNDGNIKHLLTTEGLGRDLIHKIFDLAESFLNVGNREIKNVPFLRGKTVCNLFLKIAPGQEQHLKLLLKDYRLT